MLTFEKMLEALKDIGPVLKAVNVHKRDELGAIPIVTDPRCETGQLITYPGLPILEEESVPRGFAVLTYTDGRAVVVPLIRQVKQETKEESHV